MQFKEIRPSTLPSFHWQWHLANPWWNITTRTLMLSQCKEVPEAATTTLGIPSITAELKSTDLSWAFCVCACAISEFLAPWFRDMREKGDRELTSMSFLGSWGPPAHFPALHLSGLLTFVLSIRPVVLSEGEIRKQKSTLWFLTHFPPRPTSLSLSWVLIYHQAGVGLLSLL